MDRDRSEWANPIRAREVVEGIEKRLGPPKDDTERDGKRQPQSGPEPQQRPD